MRKYLSLLLIVVLLLSVTSCTASSGDATSQNPTSPLSCAHTWISATCTKPKTCSKCQETEGEALGHNIDNAVCSRCNQSFSEWEIGEYTDEFNAPTGNKYVLVEAYGTFSNSATTNSTLLAALQIDKDYVRIMMWEYGRNLLKGTFDYENYKITILDENNVKHHFTGTIYQSGTRIYFADQDRNSIFDLLRSNETLKFYLESTKYSISKYLFTLNVAGFDAAYNSIQ